MIDHLNFDMGFIKLFDRTYSSIATEVVPGIRVAFGESGANLMRVKQSSKRYLIVGEIVIRGLSSL
ncbi:hypothetical protein UFOVP760_271 [uncultured Caudovirales phage]|uniref:Uncharacterized protein n=1 Tax=uncultured Caudovirales phage TaxID=2100421 RepID=A0A6J7XF82_9CAUD|nr:hypothetical protein UFOVP760_271 [uncultured Caudovirales phage]